MSRVWKKGDKISVAYINALEEKAAKFDNLPRKQEEPKEPLFAKKGKDKDKKEE